MMVNFSGEIYLSFQESSKVDKTAKDKFTSFTLNFKISSFSLSYPIILDHDHVRCYLVLILLLFWSDRLHINYYIRAM